MRQLTDQQLHDLLHIVQQAGEHLKAFYTQSIEVQLKQDATPVTNADLFISQFLTEQLRQLTPHIPVLSEESCQIPLAERSQWQQYWLIDPLDGTQQFIDRTDQFAILIALVQRTAQQYQTVLGIIHAPILDKTYYALDGQGAFLIEQGKRIALTPAHQNHPKCNRLRVTVGTSSKAEIRQHIHPDYQVEFIQYGSSSLKAGLVAEGKADCYVRFGDTGEWDTAATEVLLREIGGEIFDRQFRPLTYNQRETLVNPHFVAVADKQLPWQQIFSFTK